ncbi:hypothetical protein JMJ99_12255 [Companilactobacillus zhachilii]|uniref:hypothetical protein n=1 Tax=Companilactobacillus zhachilii TaxID=2304606 RepID=UPI00192117E4|nr:hypothetical protein [Companilactobacillus zhachilii]MBL3532135.1 hypothetical protein [Companilactobacillus zhachilii]
MTFNYVLIQKALDSDRIKVLNLFQKKSGAIKCANHDLAQIDVKQRDNYLLFADDYLKDVSPYAIIYKDHNGKIKEESFAWSELTIDKQNTQDYLNKLKEQ